MLLSQTALKVLSVKCTAASSSPRCSSTLTTVPFKSENKSVVNGQTWKNTAAHTNSMMQV